ncbi:tetratricopeptide repeat [Desulfoluna spongiiphila]|nr:tetratricopeptide repeat [Desulfoluna spongiiphila]
MCDLTLESCLNAAGGGGALTWLNSRPVSYISFALNWYVGQDNPFGYHVVNFIIHFLNAFLLYRVILRLLQIDGSCENFQIHPIAMLAVFLWALHPIQIQSVTYIVQRMNSLCALFYLVAFYLFLGLYGKSKFVLFRIFLISLFCLMAIASKQNGALVFLSFILVLLVYGKLLNVRLDRRALRLISVGIGLVIGLAFLDSVFEWTSFYSGYGYRDFTKMQRLLTQPRVILFYLYQLILPNPGIFSIAHSFSLSTSLLSPLSTLVSLLCIGGVVISSCVAILKGYRVAGFSILFFFINHLVESTAIPLEMVYEHRNYIPSFFLFLPFCIGVVRLIYSRKYNVAVRGSVTVCLCLLIVLLGVATYIRNKDWATPRTLWAAAIPHGEDLARVYQNLSTTYSASTAEGLKARVLLNMKALSLKDSTRGKAEYVSLRNIAGAYGEFGDYEKAIHYLKRAYDLIPYDQDALLLAKLFFRMGKLDEMKGWIDRIDTAELGVPERKKYYRMISIYFINNQEYEKAKLRLIEYIELGGDLTYPYALMGNIHLGVGFDDMAIIYFSRITGHQLLFDAYLLQSYVLSEDEAGIHRTIKEINSRYTMAEIQKLIHDLPHLKNIARGNRNPSLERVITKCLGTADVYLISK